MCDHHLLIELRPQQGDYHDWHTVDRVDLGGGLGVPAGAALEQPMAQAVRVARDYALAYPDRAPDLVIQQYSCNGPEGDEIRPFAAGLVQETPQTAAQLAADNLRLRAALRFYADRYRWQLKTGTDGPQGQVTVSFAAAQDAGERARRALRGLDPEPPADQIPQPRPLREQVGELQEAVGQQIKEISARNNRTLHIKLGSGRRIRIDPDRGADGQPAIDTGLWGGRS